jgi:hypothetical protein
MDEKYQYDALSEKLIGFQLQSESPLFRLLNTKRLKQEPLTDHEKSYLNFCRQTFILELCSLLGSLPSCGCAYLYKFKIYVQVLG